MDWTHYTFESDSNLDAVLAAKKNRGVYEFDAEKLAFESLWGCEDMRPFEGSTLEDFLIAQDALLDEVVQTLALFLNPLCRVYSVDADVFNAFLGLRIVKMDERTEDDVREEYTFNEFN